MISMNAGSQSQFIRASELIRSVGGSIVAGSLKVTDGILNYKAQMTREQLDDYKALRTLKK